MKDVRAAAAPEKTHRQLHAQPQKLSASAMKQLRALAAPKKTHRELHAQPQKESTAMALAKSVKLTSDGYNAVLATKDDQAIEHFASRVLAKDGCTSCAD